MGWADRPPPGWIGELLIQRSIFAAQRSTQRSQASVGIEAVDAFRRRVPVFVNLSAAQLGDWREPVAFSSIAQAFYEPTIWDPAGTEYFHFGPAGRRWFRVPVKNPRGPLIDARSLTVMRAIVAEASITKPVDKWDPSGRFAHIFQPGEFPNPFLTQPEAVALWEAVRPFDRDDSGRS